MRILHLPEIRKRGCTYCMYIQKADGKLVQRRCFKKFLSCPFERCPFKVLEEYEDYEQYLDTIAVNDEVSENM